MILGMSADTFTLVHVVLSLVGIGSGLIVLFGMLGAKRLDGWTALFLATTVLTKRLKRCESSAWISAANSCTSASACRRRRASPPIRP